MLHPDWVRGERHSQFTTGGGGEERLAGKESLPSIRGCQSDFQAENHVALIGKQASALNGQADAVLEGVR